MIDAEACLSQAVRREIEAHLERAYPAEGCGIVTVTAAGEVRVLNSENLTEAMREARPDFYTRSADRGYVLDGRLIVDAERRGESLRVIYHSHPDVGAYFSEEDASKALVDWGDGPEPAWPGVDYLVTAVDEGRATASVLFRFEASSGAFVEVVRHAAAARGADV